jgi:hypothetical protein
MSKYKPYRKILYNESGSPDFEAESLNEETWSMSLFHGPFVRYKYKTVIVNLYNFGKWKNVNTSSKGLKLIRFNIPVVRSIGYFRHGKRDNICADFIDNSSMQLFRIGYYLRGDIVELHNFNHDYKKEIRYENCVDGSLSIKCITPVQYHNMIRLLENPETILVGNSLMPKKEAFALLPRALQAAHGADTAYDWELRKPEGLSAVVKETCRPNPFPTLFWANMPQDMFISLTYKKNSFFLNQNFTTKKKAVVLRSENDTNSVTRNSDNVIEEKVQPKLDKLSTIVPKTSSTFRKKLASILESS